MQKIISFIKTYKSYILLLLILILAARVFIPQLDELKDGLAAVKTADKTWFWAGVVVYWIGLPILARQFMVIAKKPITFLLTLKVQIAGLFVSKLLPSSLGTISLNTYYLTKKDHTITQAASVMTMNGITSGIAYLFLIILALAGSSQNWDLQLSSENAWLWVLAALIGLLLLGYLLYKIPAVHKMIQKTIGGLWVHLKEYKHNKRGVFLAILLNGMGSFTSLFALYASAQSLGMDVQLYQAFLAYTFGNVAAGLVPVPGGIGATEAGLYSAFVLMGFDEGLAMATVLVYRLITFWIPAIPGYIAFLNLRKDILAAFSLKGKPKTVAKQA